MNKILLIILIFPIMVLSQDVSVSLSSDKQVYNKTYDRSNENDLIELTYTIHNNTNEPVKVKFEPFFDLEYTGDKVFGYNHCFRIYERVSKDKGEVKEFKYDESSSFEEIPAHDSLTKTGNFEISWLCRGAPPIGDWSFNIKYLRELTSEDNFYLLGSRYTDFTSKEFVKAWEGILNSNTIDIKILREKQ
ncbi:MAG: hypothetical protein ABI543_07670 [Ignavibacteria bacterium]